MGNYNNHPALTQIKAKYFPYSWSMFPAEFKDYYWNLPVPTPDGKVIKLRCTRYVSGLSADRNAERGHWRTAVNKYFDANGWDPAVKSWIPTSRDGSVFSGHGLPEEISLVCHLALKSGFRTTGDIDGWAKWMCGIDCNGFVCAYLTSLGLFNQPKYYHPSYLDVTQPSQSIAEIDADSVIITAKETKPGIYKPMANPGDEHSHIMVVDGWKVMGSSLIVTEQPQRGKDGPETSEYFIVKVPPADAKLPLDRVYTIRKKGNTDAKYHKLVYITRTMGSF